MLLETGRDLLKKYRGELDGKDIATHIARFRNRDEDLPRYFLGYKKMYEFNKTDQGGRDLWIGVLRPLQRGIDVSTIFPSPQAKNKTTLISDEEKKKNRTNMMRENEPSRLFGRIL
jgi:hypothetical protein